MSKRNSTFQSAIGAAKMGMAAGKLAGQLYRKWQGPPAKPKTRAARSTIKPAISKIARDVKQLKRKERCAITTFTQKNRTHSSCIPTAIMEASYVSQSMNSIANLEAVIDAVRFFNASVPGTPIVADLSAIGYQSSVDFVKSYCDITARNNYSVPVNVSLYIVKVKKDTSIAPITAMINGAADQTNNTILNTMMYPSDIHDFKDLYHIVKSKSKLLQPGQELTLGHGFPKFKYDISLSDSQTSTYQKYFHGSLMMVRVHGVVSHGSTSGVTTGRCGVDIQFDRIYKIEYEGGMQADYIEYNVSGDTIVGTTQVSQLDSEQATYAL